MRCLLNALRELLRRVNEQLVKYPPLPVCDCSIHDITTPGAAHADDCPANTFND